MRHPLHNAKRIPRPDSEIDGDALALPVAEAGGFGAAGAALLLGLGKRFGFGAARVGFFESTTGGGRERLARSGMSSMASI